jgi:hypothetical protein
MSYRVSKNEDTQNFDSSGTQIWNLKKKQYSDSFGFFFFNLDYRCLYNTIIMKRARRDSHYVHTLIFVLFIIFNYIFIFIFNCPDIFFSFFFMSIKFFLMK